MILCRPDSGLHNHHTAHVCQKKNRDIGELKVERTPLRNHAGEARIECVLRSAAPLSDRPWQCLLAIANKTAATKTLQAGTLISTRRSA